MNKQDYDIMNSLIEEPFLNQRILSEKSGYALGTVNRTIKKMSENGYIDESMMLTERAKREVERKKPKNAIILAAGYGMRMVPINTEIPKGLLKIYGEPLIERLIKQLHQTGIREIYIVVGYMKERYEYLIDEYGVKLVVNMEYSTKNNLCSLAKVASHLSDTYIIPCDIWCRNNPFSEIELYSWYMVSEKKSDSSNVRINRKSELVMIPEAKEGNEMLGICYLVEEQAKVVRSNIMKMSQKREYDGSFWEEALYDHGKMIAYARVVEDTDAVEINTYEQLRDFDNQSEQLQTTAVLEIAKALEVQPQDIHNIVVLKKGMTNRSFLFDCKNQRYIMRIPGEGTDRLIDRKQEANVYEAIRTFSICDEIVYLNKENGFKITQYIEHAHNCDPLNWDEVGACMKKLRSFHRMGLQVDHVFDLFHQIQYYEELWQGQESIYRDYKKTKEHIFSLKKWIDKQPKDCVLTHIDAVPDNFLFSQNGEIRLIDWEYSGMQDPHVDIAMFCIYALYDRKQVDRLIDLYFDNNCSEAVRMKIYAYIAVCGLLWSNWCEYKRNLGVEFGEYALCQYRYAKDYFYLVYKYLEEEQDA